MKRKSIIALLLLAATCHGQTLSTRTQDQIDGVSPIETTSGSRLVIGPNGELLVESPNGSGGSTYKSEGESVKQTVEIEAGFFTLAGSIPKLGFLDETTDAYRALYGTLVHPIRVQDAEFMPNVVVLSVSAGTGTGGKDVLTYRPLSRPIMLTSTAHGLTGTIYVGDDGELTSEPPSGVFRKIQVGQVFDANTITLSTGKATQVEPPLTKTFRATVRSRFEYLPGEVGTAISSMTSAGGDAQIWRDDANVNSSPTSDEMLATIHDRDNADEIRFSGSNTGVTITFAAESYVSDMWFQLSRLVPWATRTSCDVKVYPTAASGTADQTIAIWAAGDPDGVLNQKCEINQVCGKIELVWASNGNAVNASGGLQHVEIFGKPRLETITISPGNSKIPFDRWDILPEEKMFRCSARWLPGQHEAQTGIEVDANEIYMNFFFDWGRPWDTSSSTLATTVSTDTFGRRGYFDWVNNGTGTYNKGYHWNSIDVEYEGTYNTGWTYHPDDDVAAAAVKTSRWETAFKSFRGISPNKFYGPYTHPNGGNRSAMQGYIRQSGGAPLQSYFRRALERENIAQPLYDRSDYTCPPLYDVAGHTLADVKILTEHFRDMSHNRGLLFIPHVSARGHATDTIDADWSEKLAFILDTADGIMIFEPSTDNPLSEANKLTAAQVYRDEIDRLQTPATPAAASRKEDSDALAATSGTLSIDFDAGNYDNKTVTVTGAYSPSWTPTRLGIYSLTITMDGTGGHTVTLPTMIGTPPTIDTAANESTEIIFFWNGSESIVLTQSP